MSAELLKLFRTQLGKKQYSELEGTWLELLGAGVNLNELLSLVELAVRWATPELATTLLWVLADSLAEERRFADELRVLRRLVPLTPDDDRLTRALSRCLHNLYPEEPLLERLLQKSGLGYGEPLAEALNRFDRYLLLLPGRMVYDHEQGPGTVSNLDLLFDRITVRFDTGAELTLDIQTAANRFRFLTPDSFFYLLKHHPAQLAELAAEDPAKLVALYLRDIGKPATAGEIQAALEPLLGADRYPNFWEKAKKGLAIHPHIKTTNRQPRTWHWQEQPMEKDTTPARPSRTAPRGLDPDAIAQQSAEELLATFQALGTATERKKLLEQIFQHRRTDWQELYARIFLAGTDRRSSQLIKDRLPPEKWQALVNQVLTDYRAYPDAFLVVAENAPSGFCRQVLHRLLDIMETDPERRRRNQARKILMSDDYQLLRTALGTMDEADARRLQERLKVSRTLEPFQQDEIREIITSRFAGLNQPEPVDIIWTSDAGLERAKAELNHLTRIELPRSSEEIARARAFGDLSENYEYKAAREKQARLMQKISRLQSDLSRARVIEPDRINTDEVQVGCRVRLVRADGTTVEYAILGPWDADHEMGVISFQSPLAQKLLGKKTGDTVEIDSQTLTIAAITRAL
ncbi:MAG: transcription elongation factor GreA [bacterium]